MSPARRLGVALGESHWDDDAYPAKLDVVGSARIDLVSFTFGCPPPRSSTGFTLPEAGWG